MKKMELSALSFLYLNRENSFTKEQTDLGILAPWYLQAPRPVHGDT